MRTSEYRNFDGSIFRFTSLGNNFEFDISEPHNTADYIIFKDEDGYVYVKNGRTGKIEYRHNSLLNCFESIFKQKSNDLSISVLPNTYTVSSLISGTETPLKNLENIHINFNGATLLYNGEIPAISSPPQRVFAIIDSSNIILENLTIDTTNAVYNGGTTTANFVALAISDITNGLFQNIKIYHNGRYAVTFIGNTSFNNVVFRNSKIINYDPPNSDGDYDSGGHANDTIATGSVNKESLNNLTIESCYVKNAGSNWNSTIGIVSAKNISISNNIVVGMIYLIETGPWDHVHILNNKISTKNNQPGISLNITSNNWNESYAGQNIIIANNIINGGSIHCDVNTSPRVFWKEVIIVNNIVKSNQSALFLRGAEYINIANNYLEAGSGYRTIYSLNNKHISISGNYINSDTEAIKIERYWSDVPITYATVTNNVFLNNTTITLDGTVLFYKNSATATFSGDGSATQFKIEHGLVSTPSKVLVTPMSADAAGDFYVTADDTYIYVNYSTAPPSGTDNVKLSWYAEV